MTEPRYPRGKPRGVMVSQVIENAGNPDIPATPEACRARAWVRG